MSYTFFISACELSGDNLGAGLISALKNIYPDAKFKGIAGPKMIAAGCEAIESIDALSVMGIWSVIPKLPKILSLRHRLIQQILQEKPMAYIGIDGPDFNLPIEGKLKKHGIKTIHYVCPTVWAWREHRVKKIRENVDLLLSVFPFEKAFLKKHDVNVEYIGHRSADILPTLYTKTSARDSLNIHSNGNVIALLPGSRKQEIRYLGELFLNAAKWCAEHQAELQFIVAAANPEIAKMMRHLIQAGQYDFPITVVENNTYAVIKAADVVLVTSGTATLETFLLDQPMVVVYKMNALSWLLARLLIKVKFCSIPNLLANQMIVPELLQDDANPENIGKTLLDFIKHPEKRTALLQTYQGLLSQLRMQADERAAHVISEFITRK